MCQLYLGHGQTTCHRRTSLYFRVLSPRRHRHLILTSERTRDVTPSITASQNFHYRSEPRTTRQRPTRITIHETRDRRLPDWNAGQVWRDKTGQEVPEAKPGVLIGHPILDTSPSPPAAPRFCLHTSLLKYHSSRRHSLLSLSPNLFATGQPQCKTLGNDFSTTTTTSRCLPPTPFPAAMSFNRSSPSKDRV